MKAISILAALTVVGSMASANVLGDSAASSQDLAASSKTLSGKVVDMSGNSVRATGDIAGAALKGAGEMTLSAFAWSGKTATAVFTWSGETSQKGFASSTNAAKWVVTKAGDTFECSVNSTSNGARVVVDTTGKVMSDVSGASVGSAKGVKDGVVAAGTYMMDASGKLWDASGKMVGQVWTSSKKGATVTVEFVTDSSGKIFTASKAGGMLVVNGTKDALQAMGNAFESSSEASNKWVLTPLANGSAVLVNGSKKYLVMAYEALVDLIKSGEENDISQYEN